MIQRNPHDKLVEFFGRDIAVSLGCLVAPHGGVGRPIGNAAARPAVLRSINELAHFNSIDGAGRLNIFQLMAENGKTVLLQRELDFKPIDVSK